MKDDPLEESPRKRIEKSAMADKNILIVEDTRDLGRLLQSALATLGPDLKVHVVPSAEEALLESPRRKFSLTVVDVRLPGITGFELISKLRARQGDLKVIVITGMLDAEYRQQSEQLKVDAFFTKPLEMGVFLSTVERLLDLKPAAAPAAEESAALDVENLRLPELIAGLRQECAADSVVLLDENGRVAARAGNSEMGVLETEGGPLVMASLSAAQKVWRLVGQGAARGGQFFSGEKRSLVLMPVGEFALAVTFPAGCSLLRLSAALEAALAQREGLLAVLTKMGAPVQLTAPVLPPETLTELAQEIEPQAAAPEPEPEPATVIPVDAEELGELLSKSAEALKDDDVDAFWKTASERPGTAPLHPDALTYDQARQLGLAPEEGNATTEGGMPSSG